MVNMLIGLLVLESHDHAYLGYAGSSLHHVLLIPFPKSTNCMCGKRK